MYPTPFDACQTCAQVDARGQRSHRLPQNIHRAQQELRAVLEVDQQRRAAVSASRVRSRVISRAEGTIDSRILAERSNVANAAAEQLRKMAETKAHEVSCRIFQVLLFFMVYSVKRGDARA